MNFQVYTWSDGKIEQGAKQELHNIKSFDVHSSKLNVRTSNHLVLEPFDPNDA